MLDLFEWVESELHPEPCPSTEFIYDDMESQSGECLPIIYQPFDPTDVSHWADRGHAFDFLLSTRCEGGRVLDFGPGDGWPSLLLAPFVSEVLGVDGSPRRVKVCAANAWRLGLENANFLHVPPGEPLPFPDGSFDAAVAASSLEQTPSPAFALSELHRVLRPGGRLRLRYEGLARYREGQQRAARLWPTASDSCRLLLYDRDIAGERALMIGLDLEMCAADLAARAGFQGSRRIEFEQVTIEWLTSLREMIVGSRVCSLRHPSGATWAAWLDELGFQPIEPVEGGFGRHSGGSAARFRFQQLEGRSRPREIATIDALLRPLVELAVQLPAPLEIDPMVTAIK